ncbi:MAG: NAD(+) synthase [Flavobacteriales bacterium]
MKTQKVINHIVNWLDNYLTSAKMDGFVVGISGGIDSAVTSTLCAMTGHQTLCVEMPIHQAKNQVSRGKLHINDLQNRYKNITHKMVDLTPVFEIFKEQTPKVTDDSLLDLTLANTRARLRMSTLYYFAGLQRFLVAGTGNKVEDFGVGFFTKYGDGGVDISPIADLLKSEVYEIAQELQITPEIIKAAPTDGLFGDNRTDEDQIGASYNELEWAMKMQEKNHKINDFTGREKEVYSIYLQLNHANQHKMKPIPICEIPMGLKS